MVDKIGDTMKIAILPGDGIGPEIISQAVKVLNFFGLGESLSYSSIGGSGYCLLYTSPSPRDRG